MKLHFEPNLDYQHAAIESVCDLFRGQEICRTEFTVTQDFGRQMALTGTKTETAHGSGRPACAVPERGTRTIDKFLESLLLLVAGDAKKPEKRHPPQCKSLV